MFAGGGDDVTISLTAVDNITPVLRQVSQGMGVFTGDATRMVSSLAQLGAAALPIMAIGGAFIYAGQQASMVQQNVANLNAVLHATSEQLAAIRNNGLALSQATQFTDAQILASQRQLAKGGASAADLAQTGSQGVSGATLNLASATQSDPTAAATAMTTASSSFQIPIQDAAKTATTLASAVDSSVGSLSNQASALKQVGVVAKAAGFDLKDTVTAVADLQNNGMLNDSGTGLKTFLTRIEAPSATSKKVIDDLGLSFYDLQGKLKPIPELFDEIHTKLSGLDQQTANDALTKIFGVRGVRVADVALEQGSSGFIDTAQSMAEKGDAAEIAARKLDTFQGSASKAVSSLNVLAVQFGSVLLPGMKDFADLTEGTANKLSQLNNAAAVVPQVAVGIAAIAGIAKVGSFIDNRQETTKTAQQSKLDQANQERIAATADYNNAVVAAEFDADSKIAAAHANMVKGLEEIDQQRYDAWIALEEKTADALNAVEAKQIAMVKEVTDATLASIAEIQQAQQDAAEKTIARAQITADTERKMLAITQADQVKRASFPVAIPEERATAPAATVMAMNQQADREVLAAQQKVRAGAAQEIANLETKSNADTLNKEIDKGQRLVAETGKTASAELDIIKAKAAQEQSIRMESTAQAIEAEKMKFEGIAAAQEAQLFNKVGGAGALAGPTLSGAPVSIVSGTISDSAKNIKVPAGVTLTAGEVAADTGLIAGLKSKGAAVIGTAMAAAGEFIVPALIALTVVEMVIKPIDQAIIDRAVKNDSQLNNLTANVDSITASRGQSYADQVANTAQTKQDIQKEIDQKQAELDAANKSRGGVPVLGGIDQGVRGILGIQPADLGALSKEIATLKAEYASLDQQTKKTDLMPEAALSKANDTLTTLLTQVDAGTLSVADFTSAWATAGKEVGEDTVDQLEKQGVSLAKANELLRSGIDLAKQHAKALDDARQQAEADYMASAQTAQSQLALGATPDMVDVANFSKHADQTDATKVEVADAKKSIEELKAAWTGAQQVVNGIDISKGFDAFAKLSDSIALANRELANVGQSSAALSDLGRYADMFKQVTDAETAASAAMDGYNLTLSQSQTYMNDLTGVQKEFETALEMAERRQAAGRASSADTELIKNAPNIRGNLANQQETISEHMVLDVLGTVKNLPDFASLDSYVRDIVEKGGGGITIVATIQSDAKTARQQMEDILKPPITVTIIPDISQFSPALIASISKYGGATQGGTYNDTGSSGGAPPPGGPPALPPTAANSYTQIPGNTNPLTYHDLNNDQYATLVAEGSGGKNSPFNNPDIRDQLLAAAREANVDPRLMLDTTRFENNDATNISNQMLGIHNYGGIKYDPNNPNEAKGPKSPEGDYYAAFDSAKDFFKTLAANLSTGEYANDFAQGNTEGIRRRYVAGNANPTPDQQSNIMNFNNAYWGDVERFPAGANGGTGAGGALDTTRFQQALPVGGTASAAGAPDPVGDAIAKTAASHLNEAKQATGQAWDQWCETFVDNVVQETTGVNFRGDAAANPEAHWKAALAGLPGAGKPLGPNDVVKPGDIAEILPQNMPAGSTYDPSDIGHTGIVAEDTSKFYNTSRNGIVLSDIPAGTVFIRPDGQVVGGPQAGTTAYKAPLGSTGNAAVGTINAEQTPDFAPLPVVAQPTASQLSSFSAYGAQMGRLDSQGQGTVDALLAKIQPLFNDISAERGVNGQTFGFNRTSDPNPFEKQQIDNAGLAQSLDVATKVGVAVDAINHNLPVTAQMYKDIATAAGPVGDLIVAQVQNTADLAQATQKLTDLKATQAAADTKHQQDLQTQQDTETRISNQKTLIGIGDQSDQREITANRLVISRKEQDDDTARQRKQTLDQRAIDDSRTAQQRDWQDEQTRLDNAARVAAEAQRQQDVADTNHKQSLDDAYQVVQRQEEDQQRILNFRGGQDMIALQDAKKTLDDQHRVATEGMQQNEGLYVSLGKGSGTEAQATAYASQAAAIDDARKKADNLYAKQSEANTRAQDALTKYNAQVLYNLQTEQIAADRKHQDDLKGIDEAATKRQQDYNNQLYELSSEAAVRTANHLTITRQQEDEDKARTRGIEDQQFQITAVRTAEQRQWQDEDTRRSNTIQDEQNQWTVDKMNRDATNKQINDQYATDKLANQQAQTDAQARITSLGKEGTALDALIAKTDVWIQKLGVGATVASGITDSPAAPPSNTTSTGGYTRRLGFATGTGFSPGGDAQVNEQGGEMRTLLTGETIVPADQTKRMFDALLSVRSNVTPISAAPSYHEGNITIQMGDSNLSLSAAAQARIRAIVQDEVENQQPTTYTARQKAMGGMKR